MRFRRLEGFQDDYKRLLPDEQALVDKALQFFVMNPRHPSLRLKKRMGSKGIWEGRASLNLRFTFTWERDLITLRAVGHHDEV